MVVSTFRQPPKDLENERKHRRDLAVAVEQLFNGRSNNVLDVTLTASSGSTAVTDSRIGVNSVAICIPTTANASAIALPYRDFSAPVNGSMSLIHANDIQTDKTFKVILVG